MSTIPIRPVSPTTGRCRKCPVTMDLAASWMLVAALMTVGCVVYQGPDPDVVDVLPVRHGLDDVSLGDDADGLLGLVVVHDHPEPSRPRASSGTRPWPRGRAVLSLPAPAA